MNRKLRHVVARMQAARFAPDLVAATIHHDQLTSADRDCVELFQEIQLGENLDGVRQDVEADAQLANGCRIARTRRSRCRARARTALWRGHRFRHQRSEFASRPSREDINGEPVSVLGEGGMKSDSALFVLPFSVLPSFRV